MSYSNTVLSLNSWLMKTCMILRETWFWMLFSASIICSTNTNFFRSSLAIRFDRLYLLLMNLLDSGRTFFNISCRCLKCPKDRRTFRLCLNAADVVSVTLTL